MKCWFSEWPKFKSEKEVKYTKLAEFLAKWQNPREADALTRVQVGPSWS